ncbi:ROK family protein [Companilactobacillus huachuanensis]|uniref:ROK family protein n=1 Tax=Companilactobacillus huachuanensis TaxID=2559914 RepID=A0ABW1RQJ6_9LACO|nr:ROK family protein [Companilactobacillus huachuanensis]
MKKVISVDIGGTAVKFALISENGEVLKKWNIDTNVTDNGGHLPDDIVDSVKMNTVDTENDEIIGIGIGVPGPISNNGGNVLKAVNLGWNNVPLRQIISAKLNLPVVLLNDANAATLGEMWKGAAQNKSNFVFITLGTGVGGGIVIDGKVINGVHSAGGEIGHIPVESDEHRVCGCGNINCLETFASANGLVKTISKIFEENNIEKNEYTSVDLFEDLEKGNKYAQEALDLTVKRLGLAIAGIINALDVEGVIIGGGLSNAGDALLDPLREQVAKNVFPQIRGNYSLKKAYLGNDAGILGDAYAVFYGDI